VETKKFLTYNEVAVRGECCKRTVRRYVESGLLKPCFLMTNRPRISIAEVERYERVRTGRRPAA
jgi:hypothetical protein